MSLLKTLCLLVAASCASMVLAGGAVTTALPDGTALFRQKLEPIASFSAYFEQSVYAEDGVEIQQSSGSFQVARPGKVRWFSEAPFEQLIVADGESLWIFDPDLEQVSIRSFQKDIEKTPAVLFVGDLVSLSESYQVVISSSEGTETFYLYPRDSDSLYTRVSMSFRGELPLVMTLEDTLGQRTEIRFHQQQLNVEIDPAEFTFVPPPDVDILREDQ